MARRRVVKLSANLPEEVYDALVALAERRGASVTETLRRAISTEKFIADSLSDGNRFLVRQPHADELRAVIFQEQSS